MKEREQVNTQQEMKIDRIMIEINREDLDQEIETLGEKEMIDTEKE